jgi:hypothetical protein
VDEDACWRWAFRHSYHRRPSPLELQRCKYWHAVSRRDGFDASGPWEAWPARPIPEPVEQAENQLSGGDGHQANTENRAISKPAKKRPARPSESKRARALLREQLAEGPKPGTLVEAAAQEAEIPKRTLLAATDALDVRTQRGQWWLPG